jgi:hypothetical protein
MHKKTSNLVAIFTPQFPTVMPGLPLCGLYQSLAFQLIARIDAGAIFSIHRPGALHARM